MIATAEFATNAIVTLPARNGELAGTVLEAFTQADTIVGVRVEWTEEGGQVYVTDHAPASLLEMLPGNVVTTRPLPREASFLRVTQPREAHPARVAHRAEFPGGCYDWNCRLGCCS